MQATRASTAAPIQEVFSSIQGEGLYLGEPQVFLRLAGCPLRCAWCDTPGSWMLSDPPRARIDAPDSSRREPGWASPFQAACWIAEVEGGRARTLSVTGGEPLSWPLFLLGLREICPGRRLHLETAGAHPQTLEIVLDAVDHVSLDLKLAGDMGPPVPIAEPAASPEPAPRDAASWSAARRACLRLVAGRDACAKVAIVGGRRPADFEPVLDELAELAPALPLVLQPVTPLAGVPAPSRAEVDAVLALAEDRELRPRVVPQVHRLLGRP